MPTYEYWCPKCEEKFTRMFVRMENRKQHKCPRCREKVGLVMSPTWHRNVFKNKSEIGA